MCGIYTSWEIIVLQESGWSSIRNLQPLVPIVVLDDEDEDEDDGGDDGGEISVFEGDRWEVLHYWSPFPQ